MLFFKVDVFIWLVILCVCFVDHCLYFCPFSFCYCVCLSMTGATCGTWTPYTPGAYVLTLRFSRVDNAQLLLWKCAVLSSIVSFCPVFARPLYFYSSTYGLCLLVWYFQTFLIHIMKINQMCIINYTCIMYFLDW